MIVVTHAFSARNAGDALLVEETLDRLERVGVGRSKVVVVALDPDSFEESGDSARFVRGPGDPYGRLSPGVIRSLGSPILPMLQPHWKQILEHASAVVAVGGGYLRAGNVREAIGLSANHLPQLRAAAYGAGPLFLMPQSIGPFIGPVGAPVRAALSGADVVCVRDDESWEELNDLASVARVPDLAILRLADRFDQVTTGSVSGVICVGRPLPLGRQLGPRLAQLASRLSARWAIQADLPGRRGDREFYRSQLAQYETPRLADLLNSEPRRVVISVRLHGALQALLHGWPAIHLAYDRKGYGAYQDLGLDEYVHDVWRFDPAVIEAQVQGIVDAPHRYFEIVGQHIDTLKRWSEWLDQQLAAVAGSAR